VIGAVCESLKDIFSLALFSPSPNQINEKMKKEKSTSCNARGVKSFDNES
jgi:hypothetical protein